MATIKGLPGGAVKTGVTTTPTTMDLSALAGMRVKIWSDDDDLNLSMGPIGTGTTLLTGTVDQSASTSALVADRCPLGIGLVRKITLANPILVVATVSLTGAVKVKSVESKEMQD